MHLDYFYIYLVSMLPGHISSTLGSDVGIGSYIYS